MLSTKNVPETTRFSKTLNPGEHTVKLNAITLQPGYEAGSYDVLIHVEGPDLGADFEGFMVDPQDPSKGNFKGQVGRVKLSPFAYKDGETRSGIKVSRDQSILRALISLARAVGKKDELDAIEADTIEDFVAQASTILAGPTEFNIVAGGRQYERNGYKQYNLFIPVPKDGKFGIEAVGVKDSKLMKFDPAVHITGTANAKPVENFEPGAPAEVSNDFEL